MASSMNANISSTPDANNSNAAISVQDKKQPVCVIILGMAGSGKSSVTKRLCVHLAAKRHSFHTMNFDPAVKNVPFAPIVDIRDTVDYKEVMKQYSLGPNGAIVTSLNLFSTMFEDVLKVIEQREKELDTLIIDTPGQIEVFCWSASGSIITSALASVYPTVIVYVIDVVRSTNPLTFMSNMIHACSILYKYKLPFVIVFNKIDIVSCDFAFDWLKNYESFEEAVAKETEFSSCLTQSLCLGIEEFYKNINACGVSAATGEGMDKLRELIGKAAVEFEDYRQEQKQLAMKKKAQKAEVTPSEVASASSKQTKISEPLHSVRRHIKEETEVLVGLCNEDEDSDSEEELDEEDMEEKKELESFQAFLNEKKDLHVSQIVSQQSKPANK